MRPTGWPPRKTTRCCDSKVRARGGPISNCQMSDVGLCWIDVYSFITESPYFLAGVGSDSVSLVQMSAPSWIGQDCCTKFIWDPDNRWGLTCMLFQKREVDDTSFCFPISSCLESFSEPIRTHQLSS